MRGNSPRVTLSLAACAALLACGAASTAKAEVLSSPNVAYAHVLGNGVLDTANSRNVVAMAGSNGLYCFKLAFVPKNAVATLADDPTAPDQAVGYIKVAVPPTLMFTCPNIQKPDAVLVTGNEKSINGGLSGGGFAFYVYWTD